MIGLREIEEAQVRLAGAVPVTPCLEWQRRALPGQQAVPAVYLKCENLLPTGSFKLRGASHRVALVAAARDHSEGVVTASSGNHGQAVAYAARRHGLKAVVVVPEDAAAPKVAGVLAHGAELVFAGHVSAERVAKALEISEERKWTYVSSYDDEAVIAGQGTLGLELLRQVDGLTRVLAPVGGGGLLAGLAVALKERNPNIQVIGVEPDQANCAGQARRAGHPVTLQAPSSIADGLRTVQVGQLTFPIHERYVDGFVTVPEDAIREAMFLLATQAHLIAEPSGAVTLAALLSGVVPEMPGTALIVSGGNVDRTLLAEILTEES